MENLSSRLQKDLEAFAQSQEKILILTGAGLSAVSGIPTFRDKDGFWTVGSKNFVPEEMATFRSFHKDPKTVWGWYLYRANICRKAQPNLGHFAIQQLEQLFEDRFLLISQNVDGLHYRAGSSQRRCYLIHGSILHSRCSQECCKTIYDLPEYDFVPDGDILPEILDQLKCPRCGNWLRPHVLWFDEMYNEEFYKYQSSIEAATQAGLLLIVGTSGATNLPNTLVQIAAQNNAIIMDINTNDNIFARLIRQLKHGYPLQGSSSELLPQLVTLLKTLKKGN